MLGLGPVLCLTLLLSCAKKTSVPSGDADGARLRVMTFNILAGGVQRGEGLSRSAEVIRAAEADVVVLQEHGFSAYPLAMNLGWEVKVFGFDNAILSRYPIVETLDKGARVRVADGVDVIVHGVHLAPYPYGPYDHRDDSALAAEDLIETAERARGQAIELYLDDLAPFFDEGLPVFLAGDFNEPSHLDWTDRAVDQGLRAIPVQWPTSFAVTAAGMKDSYRVIHPDPVSRPGNTWTPAPGKNEVHDRIDLIYFAGPGVKAIDSRIVGPDDSVSDLIVEPYPSDHRAVVSEFVVQTH